MCKCNVHQHWCLLILQEGKLERYLKSEEVSGGWEAKTSQQCMPFETYWWQSLL